MILWTRVVNLHNFRSAIICSSPFTSNITKECNHTLRKYPTRKFSGILIRFLKQLKQPESPMVPTKKAKVGSESSLSSNMSKSRSSQDDRPDKSFGFGETKPLDEAGFDKFMEQIQTRKAKHAASIVDYPFDARRYRCINGVTLETKSDCRGVSFWMFRDQRIEDNWALVFAQKLALQHECPLYVTFFLMSHYSVAGTRQYDFMLRGLQELETECDKLGIQFHLELGYAKDLIDTYCEDNKIDFVIADFCPLRDPLSWVSEAGKRLQKMNIPLYQVDAHNIIPCWDLLDKEAFGARSLRPHVHRKMPEYLTEIPALEQHPYPPEHKSEPADWDGAWNHLKIDETVKPVAWAKPGPHNGYRMLYEFISQRLTEYDAIRNIPTRHGLSCLSPYFHYGQLSVQRAVLMVTASKNSKNKASVDAFVEEAVVRRELSDNFCFYNRNYDNFNGGPEWGKRSMNEHRKDKREFIYSQKELQFAKTHDKVWNAAQVQMLQEGKMHGYLRMYWAKKILEWTPSVEEAIRIAIFLNDKYELDGRDPNGYVGIMWSMVGVHDRGWTERPIFGKIRYMNYNGCKRKFDIDLLAKIYNPEKTKTIDQYF